MHIYSTYAISVSYQVTVVFHIDLSVKDLHIQVGVVSMVTVWSISGVMVITQTRNARYVV